MWISKNREAGYLIGTGMYCDEKVNRSIDLSNFLQVDIN